MNKVNTSNIGPITRELFKENINRERELLVSLIIEAQTASWTFTPIFAALVAVINSKIPEVGKLLLHHLGLQFNRAYERNNKHSYKSLSTFMVHLTKQNVSKESLILDILKMLVQKSTNDSIEVAVTILKECGMKLTQVSKKKIEDTFEKLKSILHEGQLDKRVLYSIKVLFQVREDGFKNYLPVANELDLVKKDNQITHIISLVNKLDKDNLSNEQKYKDFNHAILKSDSEEGGDCKGDNAQVIKTSSNPLWVSIYFKLKTSRNFKEVVERILNMKLERGAEIEVCQCIINLCAENETYDPFYNNILQRLCARNQIYVRSLRQIFKTSYDTIHKLGNNQRYKIAKLFSNLFLTDSIPWVVLSNIKINEDDPTSTSIRFIKILFQNLYEFMGSPKLEEKLKKEKLQEAFYSRLLQNPRELLYDSRL